MTITTGEYSEVLMEDMDGSLSPRAVKPHTITDSTLEFKWVRFAIMYKGEFRNDSIIGIMSQGAMEWPVTFTRTEQEALVINRPQKPKAPFDYSVEEVVIQKRKRKIGATITLPKNFNNSTPIVVLASGSGAQDRNCHLMGHDIFWVIADHLANQGIGCLRFDDRGIGESNGNFQKSDLDDFSSDVVLCAKYLRKKKKFKKNPLGLIGHSEGGMHF